MHLTAAWQADLQQVKPFESGKAIVSKAFPVPILSVRCFLTIDLYLVPQPHLQKRMHVSV